MSVQFLIEDFHQITLALLNHQESGSLFETILRSAARIMDAPHGEILLPTDDTMVIRSVTANQQNLLGEVIRRGDAHLMWQAYDTAQPVTVDDYSSYSRRREVYDGLRLRAVIEIPIMVEGRCVGLLSMGRNIPDYPFSPEQIHHGVMLAQLAGLVLDRNPLYEAALPEIEERKKAERNAIALGIERKRTEMLAGFIQNASHEFRTPLSIIQTSLYFLNKSPDPDVRQQKTRLIEQQIQSIDHLITMLGLQTNLDSYSDEFIKQSVNLNRLVETLIEGVESSAEAHQHTLTVTFSEPNLCVSGDAEMLNTALRQITENALRYTPPSGEVSVGVLTDDEAVMIEIQDNGVGIPDEALPHIFTRFYRQDIAHTTPGFGLGLSIAWRIIELHGGQIRVKSEVGVGSTFTIVLPRLSP